MKKTRGTTFTVCFAMLLILLVTPTVSHSETVTLANGLEMNYKSAGIGYIPIVFIHGYSLSLSTWDKIPKLLPARYRFYSIDLRGFGDSAAPKSGYTNSDMAKDIELFLDRLQIKKAIFVGHSMGGMILQHFAVKYPERVLGLIFSNTFARCIPPKGMSEWVQKRMDGYGTKEENRAVFTQVMPVYFDAENLAPGDLEKFVEIGLKASNIALKEMLKQIYVAPPIPLAQYEKITMPTLIIIGAHDKFADMAQAVPINDAIKGSKIFVISHSGHTPMWERPKDWAKEMVSFLDQYGL